MWKDAQRFYANMTPLATGTHADFGTFEALEAIPCRE